jgi:hypothetical protein
VLLDFAKNTKDSKLVLKQVKQGVIYRMVERGFYVGDHQDFAYYPFPSPKSCSRPLRLVALGTGDAVRLIRARPVAVGRSHPALFARRPAGVI